MANRWLHKRDSLTARRLSKAGVVTIVLCLVTFIVTLAVSYLVNGTPFAKVRVTQLEPYGGITSAHVKNLELWRLVVAQFVHVKPLHMLYSVVSLFFIGRAIERVVGSRFFLLAWFVTGSVGTLYSSLFVEPPWNLGAGASQAVLGLCGLLLALVGGGVLQWNRYLVTVFLIATLPALTLDLLFASYPKPGHAMSFCLGLILGVIYSGVQTKTDDPKP